MTQSMAAFTPDCQVAAPHRLTHLFIGYISPRICLEISPLKKNLLGSRGPFKANKHALKVTNFLSVTFETSLLLVLLVVVVSGFNHN